MIDTRGRVWPTDDRIAVGWINREPILIVKKMVKRAANKILEARGASAS